MPGSPDFRGSRAGTKHTRFELDGALCLVTGGGRGIGRETALALARRGSRVLVGDVDLEAATKTAADCGGCPLEIDVRRRDAVQTTAEMVRAEHGPLDVLVNNAGVLVSGDFIDTSLEDWDWILGVNLLGVVQCCHAFAGPMLERGCGHVVNVSSVAGYFQTPTEPAYGATKAAVLALSRSLRVDWARSGVGVSAVCPGIIATEILDRARFLGERADSESIERARTAFARGHKPALVANAILTAIERNRAVVPVGLEARVAWGIRGILPARLGDMLASIPAAIDHRRVKRPPSPEPER